MLSELFLGSKSQKEELRPLDAIALGIEDSSVVEPAPRDTQVLRGCGFESRRVLQLGPRATGVLPPA